MIKVINVRFNLDKPSHRTAYEFLKSAEGSYTENVVSALLTFADNEKFGKKLIEEFREMLENHFSANPQIAPNASTGENTLSEKSAEPVKVDLSEIDFSLPKEDEEFSESDKYVDDDFLDM